MRQYIEAIVMEVDVTVSGIEQVIPICTKDLTKTKMIILTQAKRMDTQRFEEEF